MISKCQPVSCVNQMDIALSTTSIKYSIRIKQNLYVYLIYTIYNENKLEVNN